MSELEDLKREIRLLKEELEAMRSNVYDLNEQLYSSYKRIKVLKDHKQWKVPADTVLG